MALCDCAFMAAWMTPRHWIMPPEVLFASTLNAVSPQPRLSTWIWPRSMSKQASASTTAFIVGLFDHRPPSTIT